MNAFKKTQNFLYRTHVELQDKESTLKVGDVVRFEDQWRRGVLISGVITEVGPFLSDEGGFHIRIRPVTDRGIRREFHTNSTCVIPA